jgi:prophage antirepressor-like protein
VVTREIVRADAPVVIMTHEVIFEDLDHETIMAARKTVATGFDDWLTQFIAGSLDTEPSYPPRE